MGLASMYPASRWSVAPGHHGYQRACNQAIWVTSVRIRREDRSSIVVSNPLADLGRRESGYIIDSSPSLEQFLCSRLTPFLRPDLCVNDGAARRDGQGSPSLGLCLTCAGAARPRLDGPEHRAPTLKRIGASHQSSRICSRSPY